MPRKRRPKLKPLVPADIIDRLSPLYGEPVWRAHGDPMAELVLTILSQNTSDTNSGRAFMRLLARYPTWPDLLAGDPIEIEAAIQVGGLARIKTPRIKAIMSAVWERIGSFDLDFLREMPLDEAKAWLQQLPGVGPKTAACVLMFALGMPALPVDTHVHRVALRLGLVPPRTDPVRTQVLLEGQAAPEQVFPLHILMIRHGRRLCRAQRPLCPQCPLLEVCPEGRSRTGMA
ncbi:MAG TPA: endonuclease III [Dehalococcoidia bacterium]|nr:endonuclease III [Dehalococcoidia bacterium]